MLLNIAVTQKTRTRTRRMEEEEEKWKQTDLIRSKIIQRSEDESGAQINIKRRGRSGNKQN